MRKLIAALASACMLLASSAFAQDVQSEAERVALALLEGIETNALGSGAYVTLLGSRLRATVTQEAFRLSNQTLRSQWGGSPSKRELFFSSPLDKTPDGIPGQFFILRYGSNYTSTRVIQEIILEKEAGEWVVVGFSSGPSPSNGR